MLITIIVLLTVISISHMCIETKANDASVPTVQMEVSPPIDFTWELGIDCRTAVFTSSIEKSSNYSWDFTSDGIVDAWGKTVEHTYSQIGLYNVTHCVYILGSTECVSKYIGIASPEADFDWSAIELNVTFFDQSSDCDGKITYQAWEFNSDGRFDAFGEEVTYTFSYPGTYNVTLVVQDNDGFIDIIRKNVTVTVRLIADLECTGLLSWTNIQPDSTCSANISISNVGDSGSTLDWEIDSTPSWGTWELTPSYGEGLTPETSPITIVVRVIAPDETNKAFSGEVKIINSNNPSDYENVQVSLSTPKYNPYLTILKERFPLLFNLLILV